jgi:hypothetical protein
MTTEFNLSEKINEEVLGYDRLDVISVKDVLEFIRLLKEDVYNHRFIATADKLKINQIIDKLAGEKLITA